MADSPESLLEAALDSAFSDAPKVAPKAAPVKEVRPPSEPEQEEEAPEAVATETSEEPAEEFEAAPEVEAAPEPDPEFEIEWNGQKEIVKGKEQIRELLQKGKDYSQKSEWAARIRDALEAQAQHQRATVEFQRSVFSDVTELQALDQQLAQYEQIDIAAMFNDGDFVKAMQYREQRDQLRERRNAKLQELNGKQQQFQQGQAEAAQQRLAAEQSALLAKLPEWRNSEKAASEQQSIARSLLDAGYTPTELQGLSDHRALIIARKAMLYDQLMANKGAQLKQVRQAPPVVKPGAAVSPQIKAKANFNEELKAIRKDGRQGNHRAQEDRITKMLERTFK